MALTLNLNVDLAGLLASAEGFSLFVVVVVVLSVAFSPVAEELCLELDDAACCCSAFFSSSEMLSCLSVGDLSSDTGDVGFLPAERRGTISVGTGNLSLNVWWNCIKSSNSFFLIACFFAWSLSFSCMANARNVLATSASICLDCPSADFY